MKDKIENKKVKKHEQKILLFKTFKWTKNFIIQKKE